MDSRDVELEMLARSEIAEDYSVPSSDSIDIALASDVHVPHRVGSKAPVRQFIPQARILAKPVYT